MHIHHLDHCQRPNMTTYSYMHFKIWSKAPHRRDAPPRATWRREVHCSSSKSRSQRCVSIRSEAQKAVSAPNATSLRDSHLQFEFLKKRGTHCQCSGLPGFPCLHWRFKDFCQCFLQRTKQSSGYEQPESTNADKYLWETSQASIIN